MAWPKRAQIAEFCSLSERTVDRRLSDLVDWGMVAREGQTREANSKRIQTSQYSFPFAPEIHSKSCVKDAEKPVQELWEKTEPCAKLTRAVRQIGTAIKEEAKRTKASTKEQAPKRGTEDSLFHSQAEEKPKTKTLNWMLGHSDDRCRDGPIERESPALGMVRLGDLLRSSLAPAKGIDDQQN